MEKDLIEEHTPELIEVMRAEDTAAKKEESKRKEMELPSKVLFHLEPARFDDETFDQYKERRSENNAYIKKYLSQGNSYKRAF